MPRNWSKLHHRIVHSVADKVNALFDALTGQITYVRGLITGRGWQQV